MPHPPNRETGGTSRAPKAPTALPSELRGTSRAGVCALLRGTEAVRLQKASLRQLALAEQERGRYKLGCNKETDLTRNPDG